MAEAYALVTDWREKHKIDQKPWSWNSFDKYLKDQLAQSERVAHAMMEEIRTCLKPEMERMGRANQELRDKVAGNYNSLIAIVEQSASAKEAEEYLTSLGFVVTPAEKKPEKALPKVDTSFLLINKEEKQ